MSKDTVKQEVASPSGGRGGPRGSGVRLPNVAFLCVSETKICRRRAGNEGFLQEGDISSVSFTLHSSIFMLAGEWGLDCRSLTGENGNPGLDQEPRPLLQPVSCFSFYIKKKI